MGVIRPPWISKDWFSKCPFNYCDHFGNQHILASICKICKDELQRKEFYKKAGKDPYDWKYVFQDVAEDLAQTMRMVQEDAKRLGINLDNLPDQEEEEPPSNESFPIFNLIRKYGDQVEKVIKNLQEVPVDADMTLIEKAVDVLSHSRHYIIAKTSRALHSRFEEQDDSIMEELADSKTSAFFAYMAIDRNSKALAALTRHKPLHYLKEKHLKLAAVSLEMAEMIREEFFPDEKLDYKEFGCEEYDECFD